MAYVPKDQPNKVKLADLDLSVDAPRLEMGSQQEEVKNVKLLRDKVVVVYEKVTEVRNISKSLSKCLQNIINYCQIYDNDIKSNHAVAINIGNLTTVDNPDGVCAVSTSAGHSFLAVPSSVAATKQKGSVDIYK